MLTLEKNAGAGAICSNGILLLQTFFEVVSNPDLLLKTESLKVIVKIVWTQQENVELVSAARVLLSELLSPESLTKAFVQLKDSVDTLREEEEDASGIFLG